MFCVWWGVGADGGYTGAVVAAVGAGAVDADQSGRAAIQIAHEDVTVEICVIRDQIAGETIERHRASIGAEDREARLGIAAVRAGVVDADQSGRVGLQIAHKDIDVTVRIVVDQIAGDALERHKTTVGADGWGGREAVAAAATGPVDADQGGRAGLQIAHKDVEVAIRIIIGDQIGGETLERHKTPVGTDGGGEREAVAAAGAGPVGADQGGRAGFQIAHEDVEVAIRIIGDQIGGETLERHKAPVGAHGRGEREAVAAAGASPVGADQHGLGLGRMLARA